MILSRGIPVPLAHRPGPCPAGWATVVLPGGSRTVGGRIKEPVLSSPSLCSAKLNLRRALTPPRKTNGTRGLSSRGSRRRDLDGGRLLAVARAVHQVEEITAHIKLTLVVPPCKSCLCIRCRAKDLAQCSVPGHERSTGQAGAGSPTIAEGCRVLAGVIR